MDIIGEDAFNEWRDKLMRESKLKNEYKKEYRKQYYKDNKERFKIKKKYDKIFKPRPQTKLDSLREEYRKEYRKEYYKKNKEKIVAKQRKYYQENKEKIKERRKEKCDCKKYTKDLIKLSRNKNINNDNVDDLIRYMEENKIT